MKKPEAEKIIKPLVQDWLNETGFDPTSPLDHGDFNGFYRMLRRELPEATQFKSRVGPRDDIEFWFDQSVSEFRELRTSRP